MPVPAIMLQLVYGKEMIKETILANQQIVPANLQQAGFGYSFPDIDTALQQLLT